MTARRTVSWCSATTWRTCARGRSRRHEGRRSSSSSETRSHALTGRDVPPGSALREVRAGLALPEGCSVDIDTEALDMLERVARLSKDDLLQYTYLELRDAFGRRPTAVEVFAAGVHFNGPTR